MSEKQPRKLPDFMEKLRAKASNNNVSAPIAKKQKKEGLFDDSLTAERKINNNWKNKIKDRQFVKYDGKIHYLRNFFEVAEAFDELIKLVEAKEEGIVPVAFDLEWPFSFEHGDEDLAVLQVCIDLEECYVIQLSDIKKIPVTLINFMYHPKIIFHGLFVKNDMRKLARDFPVFKVDPLIEKCVELREFYNEVFNSSEAWTLKSLAMKTLGENMNKSPHVRMSDWNRSPLTEIQILYAAIDVYIGQRIYYFIRNKQLEKERHLKAIEEQEPRDNFKKLPQVKFEGKIHYLQNFFEVAEKFDELIKIIEAKDEACVPAAFDIESTFKFESNLRPVAVFQICIDLESTFVIQISDLNKIPATLTAFLYHPKIILHGVNIKSNIQKLAKEFPIFKVDLMIEKCVELGEFYNEVFNSSEKWNLRSLALHTLEEQIFRSRELQNSNWSCSPLSEDQLLHASIDVHVAQRIYEFIKAKQIEETSNSTNLTESMDQLLNF